ncbi:Aspartate carbamoyltransferase, chloroplastic [Dendrobium catenatum]|uniref:Aspartate carbamoyltransferase, chloroplastic n=1 Tax=Dendrobium catenatum TaxID=906689 RepID=A0A2I0V6U5_9ASPA|nr:Aspartate carbamoyltransferase, chloroplastic [Dendrobium catenatum]
MLLDDIKDYLTSKGVEWEESTDLFDVASKCDFIYQTRIQRERFGERIDLYEAAHGKYIVDKEVLSLMPRHAVVMHPLPRLDEDCFVLRTRVDLYLIFASLDET